GTSGYMRDVALDHEMVDARDVEENFCFKGDGFSVRAFPVEHGMDAYGYVFEEEEKRNFDKKKAEKLGIKGRMFGELQKNGEIKIGRKRVLLADVTIPKKGKKIVYSGDTMPCKGVELASKNADVLIHDATFGDEMKEEAGLKLHSTVSDAANIAKKAGAKKLILTHISNRYKDARALEEQARRIFKNSEVARDGMEILI
ncbi:MAG: MBL fold metallo-hydrolase, partial [Candidatus Micrarchaeota archaeon]